MTLPTPLFLLAARRRWRWSVNVFGLCRCMMSRMASVAVKTDRSAKMQGSIRASVTCTSKHEPQSAQLKNGGPGDINTHTPERTKRSGGSDVTSEAKRSKFRPIKLVEKL